jgi:hypothetical protein
VIVKQPAPTKRSSSSNHSEQYEEDDSSDEENGFTKLEEKQSHSAPRLGETDLEFGELKRAISARILRKRKNREVEAGEKGKTTQHITSGKNQKFMIQLLKAGKFMGNCDKIN